MFRAARFTLSILAAFYLAAWITYALHGDEPTPGKPRLAVLLIFDQFRGDYPTRWRELYGKDGINRLLNEGCWFSNCHYPYANTVTGAGHATLGTGCAPEKHGIVQNDWWDRAAGASVNCAAVDKYSQVPASVARGKRGQTSGAPDRLLMPTLGDAVKEATGGKGKVVAISLKDRGAVLPAGKKPDAAYWFEAGQFVTSTYYRDQIHDWVAAFNAEKPADRWFGKDWTRLRTDISYETHSGPDDVAGEGAGVGQGRVFPHPMTGGADKVGSRYYGALYTSPFGNELMLDFTKRAIIAEKLGQHETPDLLSLSFSSNDAVGHAWGPDSQEVLDMTLRTDVLIADLLKFLDERVGKGNYVIGMSADHGVVPLPEVSKAKGIDAARFSVQQIQAQAEAHLKNKYADKASANGKWIDSLNDADFYLNHRLIESAGLKLADVQMELATHLRTLPCTLTVFTADEVERGLDLKDPVASRVKRGFYAPRSGDVLAVVKPYWYGGPFLTGTGHGTPHPYDTHVPFIVFGPGIKPGERKDPVTPLMLPVVLGQAIGAELKTAQDGAPSGVFLR